MTPIFKAWNLLLNVKLIVIVVTIYSKTYNKNMLYHLDNKTACKYRVANMQQCTLFTYWMKYWKMHVFYNSIAVELPNDDIYLSAPKSSQVQSDHEFQKSVL